MAAKKKLTAAQGMDAACILFELSSKREHIVNLAFGWNVWNYSGLPGNLLGQICPQYFVLWLPVALVGIVLDDWIRYWKFGEERPHYRLI